MRLHLIDGSGFIWRAFHANPPMERSDGLPCGAVHGYCGMLWRILRREALMPWLEPATHMAVVFDAGRSGRTEIYPQYKANRPPVPDALKPQFALVREATRAFGVPCVEVDGYEADDVIATLARRAAEARGEAIIVSIDKDLAQLVGGPVGLLRPCKEPPGLRWYDETVVLDEWGVPPQQLGDLFALMGDAADNVPGVPKIGVKTAAKLIREYGSLDNLLANAHRVTPDRFRLALQQHAADARLSRELVTLIDDVPIELFPNLEQLTCRPIDGPALCEFLETMEFHSMAAEYRGLLAA